MLMIFDLAALGSSKSKITTGYFADSAAPGGAHRGRPERHRGRRRALARMTPLHRAVHLSYLGHR